MYFVDRQPAELITVTIGSRFIGAEIAIGTEVVTLNSHIYKLAV